MRRFTLLALFLLARPAAGQTLTDSVTVIIEGRAATAAIVAVGVLNPGDTIDFEVTVLDVDGDPVTQYLATWASADTTVLRFIDADRGIAVAIDKAPGGVTVVVVVEPFDQQVTGAFPSGQPELFRWVSDRLGGHVPAELTGSLSVWQLCTYLVRAGTVVAQSMGSPLDPCPVALPFAPQPEEFGPLLRFVLGEDFRIERFRRGLNVVRVDAG